MDCKTSIVCCSELLHTITILEGICDYFDNFKNLQSSFRENNENHEMFAILYGILKTPTDLWRSTFNILLESTKSFTFFRK